MPIYEYTCDPCNKNYNKVRAITDKDPGYACDSCNQDLTRVYSNVGVVFNGHGYYSTDNRKK